MIERPGSLERLATAVRRSPVTALLGPRQCGKTTLARAFAEGRNAAVFDLESRPDLRALLGHPRAGVSFEGYPGRHAYKVREGVTVWPIQDVGKLPEALRSVRHRRRGR